MQFHLKNGAHQKAAAINLRAGLERHNALDLGPRVVAVWGWRAGARFRAQGFEVLVLERGYLGDRFAYTSIAWNGLNGRADFPDYPADGGKRFKAIGAKLAPWRVGCGDSVLLVGQVSGDMSLRGRNLSPWYTATAAAAAVAYSLPVRFRPHPLERLRRSGPPGLEVDEGPLEVALERSAAVLTWNSNAGVDALLAGVPTVCFDPGSMAWAVAGHELRDLGRPADREAWAYGLAWRQWTDAEIASGEALEGVVERLREGVCRTG